ncbi:MAG: signal recognition particle receptor subunit alpha, partial [Rhodospirillales bacterium]
MLNWFRRKGTEPAPEATPAPAPAPDPAPAPESGWLARLRDGLSKSTRKLSDGIGGIFTKRKLDDETIEELEELLIQADLGPVMASRVTAELARTRFGKEVSPEEVRAARLRAAGAAAEAAFLAARVGS